MLEYIEGDVPPDLSGSFDEQTLHRAARLIRTFHDLSVDFVAANGDEVVCHNDLSPCNFVFRNGDPMAMIDFDAAAPGSRAHDLGYAAWLWLDIGSPALGATDQGRHLAGFVASYGLLDVGQVLDAMLERQTLLGDQGRREGNTVLAVWADECRQWTRANLATPSATRP